MPRKRSSLSGIHGSNGTIPFAPVIFPPNPSAGARLGNNFRARANGYVWVEDLAGAKLIDRRSGRSRFVGLEQHKQRSGLHVG
ncbi:hypothetical protein DFH07DRAFT_419065 [Mycena maculata]|uniref:Uncharacterized protein n=1 Tax=Mycena maculata TaxID=230809 RepID=A0AAD7JFL7_9AGAR|nr:hypothetical protein DFH07DRAFT_419065 [Mycena maculata]